MPWSWSPGTDSQLLLYSFLGWSLLKKSKTNTISSIDIWDKVHNRRGPLTLTDKEAEVVLVHYWNGNSCLDNIKGICKQAKPHYGRCTLQRGWETKYRSNAWRDQAPFHSSKGPVHFNAFTQHAPQSLCHAQTLSKVRRFWITVLIELGQRWSESVPLYSLMEGSQQNMTHHPDLPHSPTPHWMGLRRLHLYRCAVQHLWKPLLV